MLEGDCFEIQNSEKHAVLDFSQRQAREAVPSRETSAPALWNTPKELTRMLEGDCAAALQLTVAGRAPVPSLRSGQASQRQVREAVPSRKTSAPAL